MRVAFPLLAVMLLSGCDTAQGTGATSVIRSPYVATALGRIDAAQEARQLVASVDGVITDLLVERGELVGVNQPLLRVDCGPRASSVRVAAAQSAQMSASARTIREGARSEEVAVAQAQLDAATAAETDAKDRLDRTSSLISNGFVTQREVEARQNGLTAASAAVAEARAQLDLLQNGSRASDIAASNAAARAARAETGVALAMADQCILRSPVAGTVLQIMRREGEFSGASQGTPLITVGSLDRMIVRAELNERDAMHARIGQSVDVWVDGRRGKWRGRIEQMSAVMGRRTARTNDATDRFDRDVREAYVAFDEAAPPQLVGLRVTVGLLK